MRYDCFITGYSGQQVHKFPTTSMDKFEDALAWWKRAGKRNFVIDNRTGKAVCGTDNRPGEKP